MTEPERSRFVIALQVSEETDYRKLDAILTDLNAVEALDGVWVTNCSDKIQASHVLWCIIPVLSSGDRLMVMNLNGPQWHAFNPTK